jgi:hypothetical protein
MISDRGALAGIERGHEIGGSAPSLITASRRAAYGFHVHDERYNVHEYLPALEQGLSYVEPGFTRPVS